MAAHDPSLVLDMPGFYPFESGGNQYVRDFSGYGNHGQVLGFAGDDSEYVDGHLGQGVDILQVPAKRINFGNVFDFTFEDFSFEALLLFKYFFTWDNCLFWKGDHGVSGYSLLIGQIRSGTAGDVAFRTNQAGASQVSLAPTGTVPYDNYTHLVITRDGPRVEIYANGTRATTVNANHVNPESASGNDFQIGVYPGFYGLTSMINSFRIWSRVLGAAEIWNRYINAKRV